MIHLEHLEIAKKKKKKKKGFSLKPQLNIGTKKSIILLCPFKDIFNDFQCIERNN